MFFNSTIAINKFFYSAGKVFMYSTNTKMCSTSFLLDSKSVSVLLGIIYVALILWSIIFSSFMRPEMSFTIIGKD